MNNIVSALRTWPWIMGPLVAALIFSVLLLLLAVAHRNERTYPAQDQLLLAVHSDQCERPVNGGAIVEVQNTLSNVAYGIAGMLILLVNRTFAGMTMGVMLVLLSIASGLYHATLADGPQTLDVIFVYSALFSLSSYIAYVHAQAPAPAALPRWALVIGGASLIAGILAVGFLFGPSEALGAAGLLLVPVLFYGAWWGSRAQDATMQAIVGGLLAVVMVGLSYAIKEVFHLKSEAVFGVLVAYLVLQLVALGYAAGSVRWNLLGPQLAVIVAVTGTGFFFRLSDGYGEVEKVVVRRLLCHPDSAFQPHAHWHLLSALSLLLAYDLVSQFLRRGDAIPTTLFPAQRAFPASPSTKN